MAKRGLANASAATRKRVARMGGLARGRSESHSSRVTRSKSTKRRSISRGRM